MIQIYFVKKKFKFPLSLSRYYPLFLDGTGIFPESHREFL